MKPAVRKTLIAVATVGITMALVIAALYAWNVAPTVAPVSTAQAADSDRPFVVKLHAQWCPVCMSTKAVWSQVEAAYADRANLVVFDFTNENTTDASRAEAERLGLGAFFEENVGWTGAVVVLDGRTRQETAAIQGSRNFAEYRTAIDAALSGGGPR
jgi:thiol-disulfide isomerase/thioredoxin